MSGRTIVAAVLVALLHAPSSAWNAQSIQNVDLVDIDVVVTGADGRPVTGLKKEDFEIREDGKPVPLQTFLEHSSEASPDGDAGRSVVILLDDVTMPRASVDAVKAMATYLVTQARPNDDLSVIRFRSVGDEPFGDRDAALARIAEYQGAMLRYRPAGSPEDVLKLVASVSKKVEAAGRRRKILLCIGAPQICSITRPGGGSGGWFYDDWMEAVSAAARANLSIYALLAAPGPIPGESLVQVTGGTTLRGGTRPWPLLDRVWQDAGHHYLLGYWPAPSSKRLHSIGVKVARPGVRVLARRERGN